MATNPSKDIDTYIKGFPKDTQEKLNQVRAAIKTTVAGSEETISYAIPAFTLKGQQLVYFAGYKNHIGLYPVPTAHPDFEEDFAPYKTSGKGAIQFPLDKPLPISLIKKIVKFRIKEFGEKAAARSKPRKNK